MQKKLTVGELKASLKGVPEDLVVEFTSDTEESGDIILEYARRVKYELPVGQKFDDTGETGVDYFEIYSNSHDDEEDEECDTL